MINIRSIKKLLDGEGLTLKEGKPIRYKTGWQVATDGITTTDPREAIKTVKAMNGNAGIWFENGIYYIDRSKRVNTKKEALEIGRACNQISVYGWRLGNLAYCGD